MCEAIRITILYDLPDKNGVTRRDKLSRTNNFVLEPEIHECAMYLFELFFKIDTGRQCHFDRAPLSWCDLEAFSKITKTHLADLEAEIILAMDKTALIAYNGIKDAKDEVKSVAIEDTDGLKAMFKKMAKG